MRDSALLKTALQAIPIGLLILLLVALQAAGTPVFEGLIFDRQPLQSGQWWRLITAHLVHLSWSHLALNSAALLVLHWLFQEYLTVWRLVPAVLLLAIAVSLAIYAGSPEVAWYAGFSGIVVGLFVFAALRTCKSQPWISLGVLGIIVSKVVLEQMSRQTILSSADGVPTVVDAHLYGLAGGVLLAAGELALCKLRAACSGA